MPDYNKIQRQPDYRIGNVPKNDRERQRQRQGGDDRSVVERKASPSWSNAWPNNYGYQRSNEAHARNAERKALKDRARTSDRYYDSRDYRQYGYNYDQRDASRDSILRSVISRVLASDSGAYNYVPQYDGYNYGIPYQPVYYGGGYYDQYPQYQSYSGTSPYYYDSQPYGYAYSQNYGDPYYSNGYTSNPGIFNLSNSFSGGGFIGRLFSKLLALGYNQGYNDAQYARSNGYGDQYYQDPYVYQDSYGYQDDSYQNAGYDRYSCLAENRRYMSEGYELGYRDALNSRNQYDGYNNSGSGDLVSLLLGNILRIN